MWRRRSRARRWPTRRRRGAAPRPGPTQAQASGAPAAAVTSRGYREEMEDFAYCVRLWKDDAGYAKKEDGKYEQRLPRCHGEVAMSDAIVALAANEAMHRSREAMKAGKGETVITFRDEWFDGDS